MKLLEYAARNSKRFTTLFSDIPHVIPIVAPGMAVKLYADQNPPINKRYLNTSDLDITVFVKNKVSTDTLRSLVSTVFERYDEACEDYVREYNKKSNKGARPARLVKRCPGKFNPNECPIDITRKQGEPFFNRHIYAFKRYFMKIDGVEHELMDVVVAHQPGISCNLVDKRMSSITGVPMPKIKHLVHELILMVHVDILGQSVFNKKRHPVSGKESRKGLKDLYRLRFMLTLTNDRTYDKFRALAKHLLNIITKKSYSDNKKSERLQQVLF